MVFSAEFVTFGDAILAGTCPSRSDGNLRLFRLETHCANFYIVARISEDGPISYEVLKMFETVNFDLTIYRQASTFYDSEMDANP